MHLREITVFYYSVRIEKKIYDRNLKFLEESTKIGRGL